MAIEELFQRRLLLEEIKSASIEELSGTSIHQLPTMRIENTSVVCLRCGSVHEKKLVKIQQKKTFFYYCPACIQLGRVESRQNFYTCNHLRPQPVEKNYELSWDGKLTLAQKRVSQAVLKIIRHQENFLIHAVTGAGKTEMLFKPIEYALQHGKRVGIASPRVDVCLELYPRFTKVFPSVDIMLLHGKQEEDYRYTPLVICTTHQLLRFYKAFDVLIIDEVDAFPFVDNPMLTYGVEQAIRKKSSLIYLTATPTPQLLKQVATGKLQTIIVPERFHGHPLPVPKNIWIYQWENKIKQSKLPYRLLEQLNKQFKEKRKTLLFCPSISLMKNLGEMFQKKFPHKQIGWVDAKDNNRHEKVMKMRREEYDLLLTTTILERGVTFQNIDVIVLGANHEVFNKAALIQIAGRVGRSKTYPTGKVLFIHDGLSKNMKRAIKEIKMMNQLAKRKNKV